MVSSPDAAAPAVVLALLNPVGGVARTTWAFGLGWALAAGWGLRVALVDLDPAGQLSRWALGPRATEGAADLAQTLQQAMQPAVPPRPPDALVARTVSLARFPATGTAPPPGTAARGGARRPGVGAGGELLLVPAGGGHELARLDTQVPLAEACSGLLPCTADVPGLLAHVVGATAAACDADWCLLDLGPGWGALNRMAFATSTHFVVPVRDDWTTRQLLAELPGVLGDHFVAPNHETCLFQRGLPVPPRWPLPDRVPQCLGVVSTGAADAARGVGSPGLRAAAAAALAALGDDAGGVLGHMDRWPEVLGLAAYEQTVPVPFLAYTPTTDAQWGPAVAAARDAVRAAAAQLLATVARRLAA